MTTTHKKVIKRLDFNWTIQNIRKFSMNMHFFVFKQQTDNKLINDGMEKKNKKKKTTTKKHNKVIYLALLNLRMIYICVIKLFSENTCFCFVLFFSSKQIIN